MKHKTFNTITGLIQEEMAMWLSIPRSQWSMYESGKRNLPQKSSASFAMLLEELKKTEKRNEEIKVIHLKEEKAMSLNFSEEIKNIELDVLRLQGKVSAMEAKRNKCFAA